MTYKGWCAIKPNKPNQTKPKKWERFNHSISVGGVLSPINAMELVFKTNKQTNKQANK